MTKRRNLSSTFQIIEFQELNRELQHSIQIRKTEESTRKNIKLTPQASINRRITIREGKFSQSIPTQSRWLRSRRENGPPTQKTEIEIPFVASTSIKITRQYQNWLIFGNLSHFIRRDWKSSPVSSRLFWCLSPEMSGIRDNTCMMTWANFWVLKTNTFIFV